MAQVTGLCSVVRKQADEIQKRLSPPFYRVQSRVQRVRSRSPMRRPREPANNRARKLTLSLNEHYWAILFLIIKHLLQITCFIC